MKDGLPANYVDDILVDRAGFLWVATSGGGLCRYDGSELLTFSLNTTPSVKSQFVRNIVEDRFNHLWIASEGGLDVWNLRDLTDANLHLPLPEEALNTICSYITLDATGAVWVKIAETLYRITMDGEGNPDCVQSFTHKGLAKLNYVFKDVDGDGTVWAPLDGRLYKIGPGGGETLSARPLGTSLDLGEDTYVSDFLPTGSDVWVSTENGLYRIYKTSGEWKRYTHDPSLPTSLTQNFVTALARTSDGQLLASTLHGLNVYNPVTDDFGHLGEDVINGLTTYGNALLMGTENDGWKLVSPKQLDMKKIDLGEGMVNALWQQEDGRLWAGVVEGGLYVREPGADGFIRLTREKNGLSHNSVSALRSGPEGQLYVGTWGGGVDVVSTRAPYRVLSHLPSLGTLMDYVGVLEYDRQNGLLWIGSNQGIFQFDPRTGRYAAATSEQALGCIGSCIDREGRLWMGCQQGVFIFDLTARKEDGTFPYRHYRHKLDAPEMPVDDKICCVTQAPDGTIWLGSNGGGVYQAVPEADGWRFRNYSTGDGLSNNQVRGLGADATGHVWVSTEHGLNRLSPLTGAIVPFFRSDGLPSDYYHWNNAFQGSDGLLYFGHQGGISVLNPAHFAEDIPAGPLRFTQVSVGDREYRDPFLQQLRMHERDRSLRFHFSVLGPGEERIRYLYRLEGFEKGWEHLPSDRQEVSYSTLPGGDYRFRVKAMDPYGKQVGELLLPVRVTPYYYRTWWFYLLVALGIVIGGWIIFLVRTRSMRRRQEELEHTVEERTREIREKAEELHRQNEVLSRQNEELASRKMLFAPERRGGGTPEEEQFMEKALDVIRRLYKDPNLDVGGFCQAMGISKTLLNTRLQETFGQPIGQFIRTYRLAVAREMLESGSGATVSEIAYEVGFNDPKYFTRCFTKEFGKVPSKVGK